MNQAKCFLHFSFLFLGSIIFGSTENPYCTKIPLLVPKKALKAGDQVKVQIKIKNPETIQKRPKSPHYITVGQRYFRLENMGNGLLEREFQIPEVADKKSHYREKAFALIRGVDGYGRVEIVRSEEFANKRVEHYSTGFNLEKIPVNDRLPKIELLEPKKLSDTRLLLQMRVTQKEAKQKKAHISIRNDFKHGDQFQSLDLYRDYEMNCNQIGLCQALVELPRQIPGKLFTTYVSRGFYGSFVVKEDIPTPWSSRNIELSDFDVPKIKNIELLSQNGRKVSILVTHTSQYDIQFASINIYISGENGYAAGIYNLDIINLNNQQTEIEFELPGLIERGNHDYSMTLNLLDKRGYSLFTPEKILEGQIDKSVTKTQDNALVPVIESIKFELLN